MAIKPFVIMLLPVALLLLAAGSSPVVAQLELGYYSKTTCPNVEAIIRTEMEKIISAAPTALLARSSGFISTTASSG